MHLIITILIIILILYLLGGIGLHGPMAGPRRPFYGLGYWGGGTIGLILIIIIIVLII